VSAGCGLLARGCWPAVRFDVRATARSVHDGASTAARRTACRRNDGGIGLPRAGLLL
jgi:hypothetical protein